MASDARYTERLKQHLSRYREEVLKVAPGTWGSESRTYGHVLDPSDALLNIVEPLRERFAEHCAARGWRRHEYFHHLTSSQALAFNLFLPIYPHVPVAFASVRALLGLGEDEATVDFEVELPGGDGTNIDVLITGPTGARTVVEVKLTEPEFGRAKDDERHRHKLQTRYVPLLRGRVSDDLLAPTAFFADYQLMRQLAQLRPNSPDKAILLLPGARAYLCQAVRRWCEREALGEFIGRVSVVTIEDLTSVVSQRLLEEVGRASQESSRPSPSTRTGVSGCCRGRRTSRSAG